MVASQHDSPLELSLDPQKATPAHTAQSFSVDARWVTNSGGLRFDASHYNPNLAHALTLLRGAGMELRPLGAVCSRVFIPPRFKRVYVTKKHGVPFLQGSHLVHFEPADLKYLSKQAHPKMGRWLIRKGWVLVTCSGTIGRVAIARDQWDGWAASQHILRIVPIEDGLVPAGYLYAFLRSFAGQAQLTSQIYGAVVDELTEDQAKAVLVPVPKTAHQRKAIMAIDEMSIGAMQLQEKAVELAVRADKQVAKLLGIEDAH